MSDEPPTADLPLRGRTAFVTGSSRGIGAAIAVRLARSGANVVVTGKTERPHPKLPGTIHTTAEAVENAGGRALALRLDVRFQDQLEAAIDEAATAFGGIDILVHNAGAIDLAPLADLPLKKFDLLHAVNVRAMYVGTKAALPYLGRSANPHVLALAPPLELSPHWFAEHLGYTLSKHGMSLCVLGMSQGLRAHGIAVNALWPRTLIATAAVEHVLGGEDLMRRSRRPEVVADAAHHIVTRDARTLTGRFLIDDEVLAEAGVTDLTRYAVDPTAELAKDIFID